MLHFINGRLSIGLRLALVAVLFIISAAVSAVIQFQRGSENSDFSKKEALGAAYNAQIWQSLQSGTPLSNTAEFDRQFASADAKAAFTQASLWEDRVSKATALIVAVADGSNLTLDPDLDSYYAMDAATVKLPNLLALCLALNTAVSVSASDPDRRIKIAMALDRFKTASEAALGSMDASIKNNAAGLTRSALGSKRDATAAAAQSLIAAAQAELDAKPADFKAAATAFPPVLDNTWRATNTELARLLDARITKQMNQLYSDITIVAVLAALSTLLTLIITLGLSRRFSALDESMQALNSGNKNIDIPYLDDRNETGRIAATLQNLKVSMTEREAAEARLQSRCMEVVVSTFGEGLHALAQRDLSHRIDRELPSGYRQLQQDYNASLDRLAEAIREVGIHVHDIASSADEMHQAASDMAQRTESQAGALEETSVSMKEIVETVNSAAERAQSVRTAAQTAKSHAERGSQVVQQATQAMEKIEHSAREISTIIGVIDEIAFQTNLLALNAGVEAARAGEAGKGFAVVAMEVRELAQRSAESAKQIRHLISMSGEQVEVGVKLVEESGSALARIVEDVGQITLAMNEIADAGRQQALTLQEVDKAVGQIDQAVQQNAALAEESRASSTTLARFAQELAQLVTKFQLPGVAKDERRAA